MFPTVRQHVAHKFAAILACSGHVVRLSFSHYICHGAAMAMRRPWAQPIATVQHKSTRQFVRQLHEGSLDLNKKSEQLQSMSSKLTASESPPEALWRLAECCNWSYQMNDDAYDWIAFNWHTGTGGKTNTTCNLQVVCKKCAMATDPVYPFQSDNAGGWNLESEVFVRQIRLGHPLPNQA